MLSVEDWAEIRRLHRAEQMPIKVIARVMKVSKNTVKSALAADGPRKYHRAPIGSIVDEVEPRIRELLAAYPRMPATVIAERIGWSRSIRVLSGRVAELRPVICPRIRHRALPMWLARSPSAICGSRRSSCRWGSARCAHPSNCRC